MPASREPPRRGRRGLCPEPRPPSVTMRSWGAGGGEAAPERRPGPRAARGLGRRRCGPTRDPCRSPHPPPPPRPVCRATQRRGGDSRALHLVAIQFHAAAGLLRPRADVRAGELLFILSSLSRLLPWEGSGAGGGVGELGCGGASAVGAPGRGSAPLPPQALFRPGSAQGRAHPGWGQPSMQTQRRPLPTDHTAAFPEASLGRGLRIWKLERNLRFPPLPHDSRGSEGPRSFLQGILRRSGLLGDSEEKTQTFWFGGGSTPNLWQGLSQPEALEGGRVCQGVVEAQKPTARRLSSF